MTVDFKELKSCLIRDVEHLSLHTGFYGVRTHGVHSTQELEDLREIQPGCSFSAGTRIAGGSIRSTVQ